MKILFFSILTPKFTVKNRCRGAACVQESNYNFLKLREEKTDL